MITRRRSYQIWSYKVLPFNFKIQFCHLCTWLASAWSFALVFFLTSLLCTGTLETKNKRDLCLKSMLNIVLSQLCCTAAFTCTERYLSWFAIMKKKRHKKGFSLSFRQTGNRLKKDFEQGNWELVLMTVNLGPLNGRPFRKSSFSAFASVPALLVVFWHSAKLWVTTSLKTSPHS